MGSDRDTNYDLSSPYGNAILQILDKQNYTLWETQFGLTSQYWQRCSGSNDHIRLVFSEPMLGLWHARNKRGNYHILHSQKPLSPPIVISVELSKAFVSIYPNCRATLETCIRDHRIKSAQGQLDIRQFGTRLPRTYDENSTQDAEPPMESTTATQFVPNIAIPGLSLPADNSTDITNTRLKQQQIQFPRRQQEPITRFPRRHRPNDETTDQHDNPIDKLQPLTAFGPRELVLSIMGGPSWAREKISWSTTRYPHNNQSFTTTSTVFISHYKSSMHYM